MKPFESLARELTELTQNWTRKLLSLPGNVISERQNTQNRTIKQIVGHMVDSASNNTHRVVHLQYQDSPFAFPNYASLGNNDRWIAIQHYRDENWPDLVELWKYSNLHYAHIIQYIQPEKLKNEWIAGPGKLISLNDMIIDYLRHFKLHLDEIEALIDQ
jgi:hypothetical protein